MNVTIPDPVEATREAYAIIYDWLSRPGARRSFNEDTASCVYESEEIDYKGRHHRCAVGCLLSEEALRQISESGLNSDSPVREIMEKCEIVFGELCIYDQEFLERAQAIHDDEFCWRDDDLKPRSRGFLPTGQDKLRELGVELGLFDKGPII